MGATTYLRSLEHMQKLLLPWKSDLQGFVNLLDWHSLDKNTLSDHDKHQIGAGGGYGAYLTKE